MSCCDLGQIKALIVFFDTVLMGCFVSCFRSRDKGRTIRSKAESISSDSNNLRDSLVAQIQDDSLFQSEDKEVQESLVENDVLNEELRREAQQLKLCGVIAQTPMEIRKSQKRRAFQELNGSDPSPKSSQSASKFKFQLSVKSEQENISEIQILNSKENTPEIASSGSGKRTKAAKLGLMTPAQHSARISLTGPNNNSPYPTPLILKDEMETPLTMLPSYMETPRTGKRARIRAQYVFPAAKPAQQLDISSDYKSVEEMDISSGFKTGEVSGIFSFGAEKRDEETPKISVASLSEWLKPVSAWAVRNGIPNSNTKYKEDQKVKWHATPFEERLEKVLLEEKMPPRKLMVSKRLIELEE